MTKIIPTDIAAKMKYITCPYLDRFQNFLKDNKIFKIFGLFSKIFPRIIQNRFHFSLCRMGFSLFFLFSKTQKNFNFENLFATSDLGSESRLFYRTARPWDLFLDREPCFVIRRSTLFCVNRFKWDIILKWLMETLSINWNLNSEYWTNLDYFRMIENGQSCYSKICNFGRSWS